VIERFRDAALFLERAEPWLLRAEAENNLLLAVAHHHRAADPVDEALYLAAVVVDGAVSGCAFRTPPLKVGLTRMPREAIGPLAEDVAAAFHSIPGVLGPEPEAGLFASAWSARTGARAHVGMRQGIYRLERVLLPDALPPGHLRMARPQDFDLAVEWASHFVRETGIDDRQLQRSIGTRITAGTLWLWDDGRPRSMAAEGGRTPNGSRINWVFTPTKWRGRGYASACVARLSERILASGKRFCFLYTDLSNPTSNALYRRLGYVSVCEVVEYRFVDDARQESNPP